MDCNKDSSVEPNVTEPESSPARATERTTDSSSDAKVPKVILLGPNWETEASSQPPEPLPDLPEPTPAAPQPAQEAMAHEPEFAESSSETDRVKPGEPEQASQANPNSNQKSCDRRSEQEEELQAFFTNMPEADKAFTREVRVVEDDEPQFPDDDAADDPDIPDTEEAQADGQSEQGSGVSEAGSADPDATSEAESAVDDEHRKSNWLNDTVYETDEEEVFDEAEMEDDEPNDDDELLRELDELARDPRKNDLRSLIVPEYPPQHNLRANISNFVAPQVKQRRLNIRCETCKDVRIYILCSEPAESNEPVKLGMDSGKDSSTEPQGSGGSNLPTKETQDAHQAPAKAQLRNTKQPEGDPGSQQSTRDEPGAKEDERDASGGPNGANPGHPGEEPTPPGALPGGTGAVPGPSKANKRLLDIPVQPQRDSQDPLEPSSGPARDRAGTPESDFQPNRTSSPLATMHEDPLRPVKTCETPILAEPDSTEPEPSGSRVGPLRSNPNILGRHLSDQPNNRTNYTRKRDKPEDDSDSEEESEYETAQTHMDRNWARYLDEHKDLIQSGVSSSEEDSDNLSDSDDEANIVITDKYLPKTYSADTVQHPLKVTVEYAKNGHPHQRKVLESHCQMCDYKVWHEVKIYVNKFKLIGERKRNQKLARKIVAKKKAKMEFGYQPQNE